MRTLAPLALFLSACAGTSDDTGTTTGDSGTLDTDHPVVYDPEVSVSRTRFHMRDKEGEVREVILNKPKPTGLEQSESIDLYGRVVDGQFIAGEMLMKCPSKYNEQSHSLADATDAP